MLDPPTPSSATPSATNKCTSRRAILRTSVKAYSAIRTAANSTIPLSPAILCKPLSSTSVSHSQAYQGALGFENE